MNKTVKRVVAPFLLLSIMILFMNMTKPITASSYTTKSTVSNTINVELQYGWTWNDFGKEAAVGGVAGGVGGAVAGAFGCCPAGALTGGAVGGVAGAAAGGSYYAAGQAWDYFFGPEQSQIFYNLESALN